MTSLEHRIARMQQRLHDPRELRESPYATLARTAVGPIIGIDWGDFATAGKVAAATGGAVLNAYAPGAGTEVSKLATGQIDAAMERENKAKADAADAVKLQASIQADRDAEAALAQAMISAGMRSTAAGKRRADADKAASDAAMAAMDVAGADVPVDKRQAAAQARIGAAASEYKKKDDAARKARTARAQVEADLAKMRLAAAKAIAARITGGFLSGSSVPDASGLQGQVQQAQFPAGSDSFASPPASRGVKIAWGVGIAAGVLAVLGVVVLIVRALR